MKEISLSQDMIVLVDDEDFEYLSQWKWHLLRQKEPYAQYAIRHIWRNGKRTTISMHRQILETPKGMVSDHINGNGLDNRRENLRICSQSNNSMNRKPQKGTSLYKGVTADGNKWTARIKTLGKIYNLGTFNSEIEAARTYDSAAKKMFGEFARINGG